MMAPRTYNNLGIKIYSGGTSLLADVDRSLARASNISFGTYYPGGIYGAGSFWAERDIVKSWLVKGAQRVVFHNGDTLVYEGKIDDLESALMQAGQGVQVNAVGQWGALLMRRRWRKLWADQRISEDVWRKASTDPAFGQEKCEVDRNQRIRFTPKAEAWTSGEFAAVLYTMPVGETVKKITWDYNFREGGQAWEMTIFNVQTSSDGWSITASGSATGQSAILATPSRMIELRFYARADQTPTSDGTYFGEFSNITMYSETSAIDLTEIATDVIGKFTDLNSTTVKIASNTNSLVPFITSGHETLADILTFAAGFGDASQNPWHVYLLDSEVAASPDGKPVLVTEQRPALTDYEYALRVDEPNLFAPLSLDRDYSQIWNWIAVEYIDANGWTQYLTPDDISWMKDTASIAAYGQRDYQLSIGEATDKLAEDYGTRFLARYKDPQYVMRQPIQVQGYLRSKNDQKVPVSQVRAGKRVRIENYQQDLSGTGLTFLISNTQYDDSTEMLGISSGPPAPLIYAPFTHPRSLEEEAAAPTPAAPGPEPGGEPGWESWSKRKKYVRFGRGMGYTWAAWQRMANAEINRLIRAEKQRRRRR